MKPLRAVAAIALLALLAASGYGWWATSPAKVARRHAPQAGERSEPLVDRSALETAQKLRPMAQTLEEQRLAESALSIADHLLDLAFATALREASERPAPSTPASRAAHGRLDRAAQQMIADNLQIQRLTDETARPKAKRGGGVEGQAEAALALAQSQFEVDQYEFDLAGKALIDAGGDLRGKIEALVAERAAASPNPTPIAASVQTKPGLVHLIARALALQRKNRTLAAAQAQVEQALASNTASRDTLAQRISERTAATEMVPAPGASGAGASAASTALRARVEQIAADQKALRAVDERRAPVRELGKVYAEWESLVAGQLTAVLHQILQDVGIIAGACLLLLFFGTWLGAAFDRLHLDRRQAQTLRTVTTVSLQVAAVFFILLVVVGPPGQLGTFLGLAGAGLTVALKDFIVAFIGWLVLMGKNGIRIGDWVEINGVAGEVVELGMFHTVLLETGNWTDSGHPTGRRVTFTNSFAIQGYYFNFSTSGQWLWDELQVVVPPGQDLYAVVGAISKSVQDATAENGKLAEEEWRRAAPATSPTGLSAAPAINVKPVVGGTEISLRYIVKASDRYRLRASLYQAAVDLLARKPADAPR